MRWLIAALLTTGIVAGLFVALRLVAAWWATSRRRRCGDDSHQYLADLLNRRKRDAP